MVLHRSPTQGHAFAELPRSLRECDHGLVIAGDTRRARSATDRAAVWAVAGFSRGVLLGPLWGMAMAVWTLSPPLDLMPYVPAMPGLLGLGAIVGLILGVPIALIVAAVGWGLERLVQASADDPRRIAGAAIVLSACVGTVAALIFGERELEWLISLLWGPAALGLVSLVVRFPHDGNR